MFNPEGFSAQLTEEQHLTAQGLFDTTLVRLVVQGRPSINERDGVCQYHHPQGLRCAVGFHILDHEYSKAMEGLGVSHLVEQELFPKRLEPFCDLLQSMQSAHDGASTECFLPVFLHKMESVALAHELDVSTVRALRFSVGDL